MTPFVTFIKPWDDPPNTIRSVDISEMYDFVFTGPLDLLYEVGKPINTPPIKMIIRNNTISNNLSIQITLPDYMNTKNHTNFTIPAGQIAEISLEYRDTWLRDRAKASVSPIESSIVLAVTPLIVNGPVYVRTDLPSLTV